MLSSPWAAAVLGAPVLSLRSLCLSAVWPPPPRFDVVPLGSPGVQRMRSGDGSSGKLNDWECGGRI